MLAAKSPHTEKASVDSWAWQLSDMAVSVAKGWQEPKVTVQNVDLSHAHRG